MKETRRSLLTSCIALFLCFSMLLGSTFAWFTDVVTSAGNKIVTGNLDLDLQLKDKDTGSYSSINESSDPLFNYDKWEPGYTDIKVLKVLNAGSLSFKWVGNFVSRETITALAEVIDVYVKTSKTDFDYPAKMDEITSANGWKNIGSLDEIIDSTTQPVSGQLLSGESDYFAVALHMQEDAGNEYQDTSLGAFDIAVHAAQYTAENDSFGNDYDQNAKWPDGVISGTITASGAVTTDDQGKVANPVTLTSSDHKVTTVVPAGTQLEDGVKNVTVIVSPVYESQANVTLSDTEKMLPVDVHIDGVAKNNDVVIPVYLAEWLEVGLNIGNYHLYHVENGATNEMTLRQDGATAVHNNFDYDPATGDVTLYLKSFSEVAMVADLENKWAGNRDYSWYDANATELTIANADQLAAFSAIVGGMAKDENDNFLITYEDSGEEHHNDFFEGKTVKLLADINLGDAEAENNPDLIFYPIGYWNSDETYEKTNQAISSGFYAFKGTFDGNGNTISNFYQNTWEMKGDHDWYDATLQYYRDGMGLFGKILGGTVKNLTVDNFSCDSEIGTSGVIAAYADSMAGKPATFENITITNCNPRVYNIGNGGIVGCAGWYSRNDTELKSETYENAVTFRNITVDQTNKISALWGSWGVSCAGILGQYYPNSNCGIKLENCHVAAVIDVNNDVCSNYQYYWYRYAGMFIGTIRANTTDANGYTVADTTGVTAKDCTYTMGDWNEYWYCEIVANSLASYTHDHQFSRLDNITSLSEIQNADGTWKKEGHFALLSADRKNVECYHIFKDSEGKLYQHKHEDSGYETVDVDGDGVKETVLKEDRQRYFIPFNQLLTGLDMGIKAHTEFEGITFVENGTVKSEEKFESIVTNGTYKPGQKITLGELVKAIVGEDFISKATLYAAVSPAIGNDNTKVDATFSLDAGNWQNSSLTFGENCTGAVKIVITDYFYCTPTVIVLNEADKSSKFDAKDGVVTNAYTQITLGELFTAKDGVTIGNVTATVTDPNGNVTSLTGANWVSQTINLIKDGKWTISIVDDDKYCATTTVELTVNKVDKFNKLFNKDFLYRVGNAENSPVALGTMFSEIETAVDISSVNVSIENVAGNAAGTFTPNATWTKGTIQFTGTGVVKVTISADGANDLELNLEVVEAENITSAKGTTTGGNFVLLCDVNTTSYVNYWNCTLYGNGFTYSLNGAPTAYNSKQGKGILITKNAVLDNLVIVGDVYNGYGAFTENDYYNTVIDVTGDTIIQNCYISGCAAPVRARNNVTIINSTLYGGAVGNLIIESGTVTLEDVTTANFDDGRAFVGMGIVIHSDATEAAKLVINGTLTQYNFISESKVPTDTYAKNLHTAMFSSDCEQYQFGTSPNRYVNTGIISLTSTFNGEDITDNANTGYAGKSLRVASYDGYVYTQLNTSGYVNNNCPEYKATTQGAVPPSYLFDYTNKNYLAKTDGSNDYCYKENGKVNISMDEGDTFTWDTSILTIGKGITNYTVSMNGTDYTGKSIAFNSTGDYTVTYTYTDDNNYKLDANGNITTYSVTYTKTVNIVVAVVEAATKHAEFTFGSSNTASTTITVGNSTYVMPNVSGTSNTVGSTTVNGQTIYYPIVEIIMSDGKTSHTSGWYAYFPVFSGAVTITDYADNGTGDKQNPYNDSTTTMPSGLSVVGDAKTLFKYQSGSNAGETPVVKNNKLVYSSAKIEAKRSEYNTVIQYSYTDNAGATYYYYIGYHAPAQSYTSCVTPDTLVTLADGTQKRIDAVTYEDQLLVWDFYNGKYAVAPAAIIFNHGYADNTIIKLSFSDGTVVKVANLHQFYDNDLNKFVSIDADSVAQYVGHSFAKQSSDGYTTATLDGYEISVEYEAAYGIISAYHYNIIVEGMISTDFMLEDYDLFNYFELGENMTFDEEQMKADIEKYGLYTYEDFADYLTYEQFVGFNVQYFKIAVGKGNYTYEGILELIATYLNK